LKHAVQEARKEQLRYKEDVREEGKRALKYAKDHGLKSIVLAGRPYHLDTEINHGIDKMITSFDLVILSEDSVCDLRDFERPVRVLDQWMYHSRLYRAANVVEDMPDVELVQLNSFGCGVDAVTTDEVMELLESANKLYTLIKIDEGNNLGAIKIRIRSLKAAMEEREKNGVTPEGGHQPFIRKVFTKDMRKDYTILVPQMSPIHFEYLEEALKSCGYNVVLLPEDKNGEGIQEGLRYVNNDACYPTLITLGQMIKELKTGKYDPDKTALIMSQTGGGCRASNYVALLRKALKDLGMEQIPVISFNTGILETNPGFKIDAKMAKRLIIGAVYGDIFQRCLYATRPYEVTPGSAQAIKDKYRDKIMENCRNGSFNQLWKLGPKIIKEYDELPLKDIKKPKVGVVGEILVKYHPDANNRIVELIEKEGGEAVVPEFIDFFLYGMYNKKFNYEHLSGTKKAYQLNMAGIKFIEFVRGPIRKALRESKRFHEMPRIEETAKAASAIASTGNQCGEGWLLTGEMIDLIESGATNIACLQPFACLPNHVTGKGMMKAIRERFPGANIVAIDYDPGASNVNQINRIKLMMANAHHNLGKKAI
ncbi:MAG: 2-hydroxyacyl-CoA dehydratase, partial [Firmicutes bacterium]|nr:2-hydroxyacyl-CoA dehydratase [Bacillota bacterium]